MADAPLIVVVDDHTLVAETVISALALRGHDAMHIVLPGERLLERILEVGADLVLMDLDLGVAGDGTLLVGALSRAGVTVAVLSAVPTAAAATAATIAGAVAIVEKAGSMRELVSKIEALVGVPQGAAAIDGLVRLTPSEADVLDALLDGSLAADIARDRDVALTTVRTHIRSVLSKLGVQSQVAAVAVAQRARWSPPRTSAAVDSAPPRQS
jgi:DNA-binding NarL/FixJ family response regulator